MKRVLIAALLLASGDALPEKSPLFRVFLIESPELRVNCAAEKVTVDKKNIHEQTGELVIAIACKGPIAVRKGGVSRPLSDAEAG